MLGFAFQGREPAPSLVGVVGEPGAWTAGLEADPLIEITRFETLAEADRRLAGGHIDALVLSVEPAELRLDPARPEAELARLRVLVAVGNVPADALEIEPVTENGARYIDFLFPGLLGMSLMGTGLWAIGFAVADMRQRKVLKRLLVTPMRRSSFLASFLTSRLMFLAAELALITGFGVWVLDVPLRSSLPAFAAVCTIGAVAFSAIGLLVASRTRTIEGVSGLLNLVMVPMWLGSGVFFSYERFPEAFHPAAARAAAHRAERRVARRDDRRRRPGPGATRARGAGPLDRGGVRRWRCGYSAGPESRPAHSSLYLRVTTTWALPVNVS